METDYPTPLGSPAPSVLSMGSSTNSSQTSVASQNNTRLDELKPYNNYLPVAKRDKLAQAEFEVLMAEREIRVMELERTAQKFTAPKLKSYTLPFTLNEAQLRRATADFPRTKFKCSLDANHDHPLAHLQTMIAADQAARMFPAGSFVLDLWGSPKRCSDLNRGQQRSNNPKTFHSYVSIMSEKDNIRALSWPGHELDFTEGETGDIFRDLVWDSENKEFAFFPMYEGVAMNFFSVHTLYYMTDDDIAKILQVRGSRMIAVVHRHQADKGEMFGGETTYAKIEGCVEQINSLTGERYTHRDVSFLFTSRTKVMHTSQGAYTWTMHKVTDETWIIVLTGCVSRDERFIKRSREVGPNTAANELNESAVAPTHFKHPVLLDLPQADCTLLGGVPIIKLTGFNLPPIRLSCPGMYEYLKGSIVGKPRDSTRLQDLFSLARTHVANGSNFAGKHNFNCPASEIAGHVTLAFVSGLREETALLQAISCFHDFSTRHAALLDMTAIVVNGDNPSKGRNVVAVAHRINEARKKGDVMTAVIDVFKT